jgi:hypothetical protein
VDLTPGNPLAHQAMSTVLLLRKEVTASLHEADRAIALNPFDAGCNANMGANIAFAGDLVRGCALIERSGSEPATSRLVSRHAELQGVLERQLPSRH